MIIRHISGVLLLAAALSPVVASAQAIFDERPVVVRPAGRIGKQCPTCYKGHDFGSDCFQNVWNGFEEVWTNVCRQGWR